MKDVVITDCACVTEKGFGNSRWWKPWEGPVPDAHDLRWSTFSAKPFEEFRRLDVLCRYALAAVELLALPPPAATGLRSDLGLCLGTQHGSLDADTMFIRSAHGPNGPSPTLFTYTLPSMALGEIAIRHWITGPNLCLMCGPDSGVAALREGMFMVAEAAVAGCICLGCDAVASPLIGPRVGYGFAFVLEQAVAAQERGGKRLAFLRAGNAAEASGVGHRSIASQDVLPALFRHLTSFVPHAGKPSYDPLYLRAAVPLAAPCLLCVLDPG